MKAYLDKNPSEDRAARLLCFTMALSLLLMGCLYIPKEDLLAGMGRILASRAVLFSDYFVIGGFGAAFLNAGLVMLMSMALLKAAGVSYDGRTVAALFLMPGFALFGKNILNILPFFLGVFLYCRYVKHPLREHVAAALYSTTLAPVVSELWCNTTLPLALRLSFGVLSGALIGFCIVPLAAHTLRGHTGHVLFNFGFASGFIAYLIAALILALGGEVQLGTGWLAGRDLAVLIYLFALCASLLLCGLYLNRWRLTGLKALMAMTGCAPDNDTAAVAGIGLTMVNMGVIGLLSLFYIRLIGGDLSGPVVGAVFTAIGFGASGVHPRSFLPVMAGIGLFACFGLYGPTGHGVQIAAIFGAVALAPIAGEYGLIAGVAAGMLHYAMVTVTGGPTGGLNLYNNGFAAGVVAMVMVPLLSAFDLRGATLWAALRRRVSGGGENAPGTEKTKSSGKLPEEDNS